MLIAAIFLAIGAGRGFGFLPGTVFLTQPAAAGVGFTGDTFNTGTKASFSVN